MKKKKLIKRLLKSYKQARFELKRTSSVFSKMFWEGVTVQCAETLQNLGVNPNDPSRD